MTTRAAAVAVSCVLVLLAVPATAVELNLVVGADFGGEFDLGAVTADAEDGFSVGGEIVLDLTSALEVGAGLEYGFPRGVEDGGGDDASVRHVYAVGRLHLIGHDVGVYAVGRLGWADLGGVDGLGDGGSWSAGGGVSLGQRLKLEALLNRFSADLAGVDAGIDYDTWSLRAVWTF